MSADARQRAPRPPLTLRVAITGHRRFTDDGDPTIETRRRSAIRDQLSTCLDHCAESLDIARAQCKLFFESGAATLTLITALAEGADQAAVEAARLTATSDRVEKTIEAILPFHVDDYATTMGPEAARAMRAVAGRPETGEIIDPRLRADRVFSLDDTRIADIPDADERERFMDQRYALIGDILARQADILIAVWNGEARSAVGGTSYVIGMALRQGLPVIWIDRDDASIWLLEASEPIGDVLVEARARKRTYAQDLLTKRALSILLPDILDDKLKVLDSEAEERKVARQCFNRFFALPGTAPELAPDNTGFTIYKIMLWILGADVSVRPATIDKLDAKPRRGWEWQRLRASRVECDNVRSTLQRGDPNAGACPGLVTQLAEPWGYADAVATRLGHRFRSTYVLIYIFSVAAVLLALFGALKRDFEPFTVSLEVAILASGLATHMLSKRHNIHERFLAARGIAEEMRSAWALARLGLTGRHVLRPRAPWNVWAIQSWTAAVGLPDASTGQVELLKIAEDIHKQILLDQKSYHISNALRLNLLDRILEKFGFGSFLVAFIAMMGVFFANLLKFDLPLYISNDGASAALFFGAGLPAVGAAIAGLRHQGDFEQFARRSTETARELDRIEKGFTDFIEQLRPTNDSPKQATSTPPRDSFAVLRDLLFELERVLRDDLDDWRFVYQSRPTPHPG